MFTGKNGAMLRARPGRGMVQGAVASDGIRCFLVKNSFEELGLQWMARSFRSNAIVHSARDSRFNQLTGRINRDALIRPAGDRQYSSLRGDQRRS